MSKPLNAETLRARASQAIQRPNSFQKSLAGTRKEHTQFSRVLEALLTGLLLEPGAFFHLLLLQRNVILQDLASLATDLEQLLVDLADSLERSRASASTQLTTATAKLQTSLDLGTIADVREVERVRTALNGARRYAKAALLPDLRGAASGSTGRARPEALQDAVEELERLEKSLPRLHRRLTSFLEASTSFDPVAIRTYLSPLLLQRAQDMLTKVSRAADEGTLSGSAQDSLVTLLAPEAAVDALSSARHPTGHVLRGLSHHSSRAAFPAGSKLVVDALPPMTPAEFTGTQQPVSFPVDAEIQIDNGPGAGPVVLTGSGQHFLKSAELATDPYTVTVPHLLVRIADTTYTAPLTVGSRTAAQVVAELDSFLGPLGYEALIKHDRLYLKGPGEIGLPSSGLTAQPAVLRTDSMPFTIPLLIPAGGLTLVLWLQDESGVAEFTHTFNAVGGLFSDMASLITELEGGGLGADFTFAADGDVLVVSSTSLSISSILTLSDTSTALLPPPPPPPFQALASPIPFLWGDVGLGAKFEDDSAGTELGFGKGQVSGNYYPISEVVMELEAAIGTWAAISTVGTVLFTGEAFVSAGVLYLYEAPSSPVQAGDIAKAGSKGSFVVTSVTSPTEYGVTQLAGDVPGAGILMEVELARTVLKVVSKALEGNSINLGTGTAHTPLGIPSDTSVLSKSSRFQITGTKKGDTKSKVQDLRLLGVTAECSIRLADGVTTSIESVDPGGTYFDVATPLDDPGTYQIDILPAGYSGYVGVQAALRVLQREDRYALLSRHKPVLRRVVEALRSGTRSASLVSAAKDLAKLLFLISASHRSSTSVAISLQRLGVSLTASGTAADDVLKQYSPTLPTASAEVAEAALSSLEEKGYDRAASLLMEGRYTELKELTADGASSTKAVSSSFRRAARGMPKSQRLGDVMATTRPTSKERF